MANNDVYSAIDIFIDEFKPTKTVQEVLEYCKSRRDFYENLYRDLLNKGKLNSILSLKRVDQRRRGIQEIINFIEGKNE